MKRLAIVLLLIAAPAHAQTEDPAIDRAKIKVAESLYDSESARFRDLTPALDNSGAVCGWVNGRNKFGAYVGYRPFIVFSGGSVAMRVADDRPSGLGIFAAAWARCMPPPEIKAGESLVKLPKLDVGKECNKRRERSPDNAQVYEKCEENETQALAWLRSHPTDELTAQRCRVDAYTYRSYETAKQCVYGLESESWFYTGPRAGTPESNARQQAAH